MNWLKVLDVFEAMFHYLNTGEQLKSFRRSVIMQGKASTGKSSLIKAARYLFNSDNNLGRNSLVVASTGSSTSKINCSTIHSKFKISINRKLNELSNSKLHEFQQEFRKTKLIMIDEVSLVGCSLFKKIDNKIIRNLFTYFTNSNL